MSNDTDTKTKSPGSWIGTISLSAIHLIAFALLYLVIVQMHWAFQDFFKLVGAQPTERFETFSMISDFVAAFTPIVLLVVAIDMFVVFRMSIRQSHWTSAYSHAVLLCMGLSGFLSIAGAVETMAWGAPGNANQPIAEAQTQHLEHVASVVVLEQ